MRHQTLPRRPRGYVLVYFAMLAFALMAVAALVIDIGFAVVTRRQMQTGTDAAALEGLRWRDAGSDDQRRTNARSLLVAVFRDSDSPYSGPRNFGAGPVLDFSDQNAVPIADGFKASETVSVPTALVSPQANPAGYSPSDPSNQADSGLPWAFWRNGFGQVSQEPGDASNNIAGDMVSGAYHANAAHTEATDYSRADFTADTTSPSPTSPPGNAFLVRMRRSNEGQQPTQGLSSGPPIPYLFGRGSLLAPQRKAQGITVRATSIADARPVMAVGPQSPANQIPGVTSFGLRYTFWMKFAPTKANPQPPGAVLSTIELAAGSNWSLTAQPPSQSLGTGQDGQYMNNWPGGQLPSIGWRVLTIIATGQPVPDLTGTILYCPIYDNLFVEDGLDWIVGFAPVQVVTSSPPTIQIQILNGEIASMNALASFSGGGFDPSITGTALTSLISANQGLKVDLNAISNTQPIPPVLLAPALVRSE